MKKRDVSRALCGMALGITLAACGSVPADETVASQESGTEAVGAESVVDEGTDGGAAEVAPSGGVANDIAEDEEALVATYPGRFSQETYQDDETGLPLTYNLFLPAGYDQTQSYPMVVFIADSSCAKGDPLQSLTQGLGALVWASDAWQAAHPSIVCVPTYPETILDDHNGYTTTDYVELTGRLIKSVAGTYAVDASRIYGTGQSMGCMTTLILASEYPDLYAGCMFVDGQWDPTTLKGLEGQRFVYFAAEDDQSASAGMAEVMAMFDADGVGYASATWDGTWTPDELSDAASQLFSRQMDANFISWATGTIDASKANMGAGPGGMGGGPAGETGGDGETGGGPNGGPSGDMGDGGQGDGGQGGGMGGASYHMASFDYAYRCIAVMEWLFQQ